MAEFQIVDGFNNTGTLANVVIVPKSSEIKFEERTTAISGQVKSRGYAHQYWEYKLSEDEFDAQKTEYGVSEADPSNEVTVNTRTNKFSVFDTYNAVIVLDRYERNGAFWNVRYELSFMEAI